MNKRVLGNFLSALKNPTVLVSVISQLAAIMLLMGFDINEQALMTGVGTVMSLLGSFGIISKVDMSKAKVETADLFCPVDGKITQHIKINGKMVCAGCGHVYDPQADTENAEPLAPKKRAPRKTAATKTKTPSATKKTTAPKKPAAKKPAAAARTKASTTSHKKRTV